MKVTEATKAHAQDILDYIEMFPEKHQQDNWYFNEENYRNETPITEKNFCGTTMCVAGTSVYLTEGLNAFKKHVTDIENDAARNLGLDDGDSGLLFYTMSESKALMMLEAVAAGDEEKFIQIYDEVADK